MKRLFKPAICLIASLGAVGCAADIAENALPEVAEPKIQISISAQNGTEEQTRTVIGEKNEQNKYPVYWEQSDELAVVETADAQTQVGKASITGMSEDKRLADFTVELAQKSASSFDYTAYYPFAAYSDGQLTLPANQTARESSADAAASIMRAECNGLSEQARQLDFSFWHVAAYIKMTVKGLPVADGETVRSVKFTASGKKIAGVFTCDGAEYSVSDGSSSVDVDVSALGYDGTEDFDVWFAVLPTTDVTSFTVAASTDDWTYTRTVNASGRDLGFERGIVSRFSVDMASAKKTVSSAILEKERNALVAFYNSTNGDEWKNNENWLSDKPVGEWYGVITDDEGRVINLNLYSNNLNGELPEELGDLTNLELLTVYSNNLHGEIPDSIKTLKYWLTFWANIVCGDSFDLENEVYIAMPKFDVEDTNGNRIVAEEHFAKYRYTVMCKEKSPFISWLSYYTSEIYNEYKDRGVDIIYFTGTESGLSGLLGLHNIYPIIYSTPENPITGPDLEYDENFPGMFMEHAIVVDWTGRVVYFNEIRCIKPFLDKHIKGSGSEDIGDEDKGDF